MAGMPISVVYPFKRIFSDGLAWLGISVVFLFLLFSGCKSSLRIRCSFIFSTVLLFPILLWSMELRAV